MFRCFLLLIIIVPFTVFAQKTGKVEVTANIIPDEASSACSKLVLGKLLFFFEPDYPSIANSKPGVEKVEVSVKVNEFGTISEVLNIEGIEAFKPLAERAAKKAKFGQTTCEGEPIAVTAKFTYIFQQENSTPGYFFPADVEDFVDLNEDSAYYDSISSLTDNYGLSFGYSGNTFRPESPLTRGELAQFLTMTIDFLFKRAKDSKKIPSQIGLVKPFNPYNLKSVNNIVDIDRSAPYFGSVAILLQNYNIALISENSKFEGKSEITKIELIELWTKIFGRETVPVNFLQFDSTVATISRGEFAIFLNESMQVLSYKVLP